MEAQRTPPPHLPKDHQQGHRLVRRSRLACSSAYPWCKDHIVSVVVLLAFPVTIGMYFWNRPDAESAPLPRYLKSERNEVAQTSLLSLPKPQEQAANTFAPILPILPHPSPLVTFANVSEEEDSAPPLPIAVDHPRPISHANEGPTLPWPGLANDSQPLAISATQCVWLTGSIEPAETLPDVIQNASRVHELTMPSRN